MIAMVLGWDGLFIPGMWIKTNPHLIVVFFRLHKNVHFWNILVHIHVRSYWNIFGHTWHVNKNKSSFDSCFFQTAEITFFLSNCSRGKIVFFSRLFDFFSFFFPFQSGFVRAIDTRLLFVRGFALHRPLLHGLRTSSHMRRLTIPEGPTIWGQKKKHRI